MEEMFLGVTLSTVNYDALLNAWSSQSVQSEVTFHGGDRKYSSDFQRNRDTLTGSPFNWTISDGGVVGPIEPTP